MEASPYGRPLFVVWSEVPAWRREIEDSTKSMELDIMRPAAARCGFWPVAVFSRRVIH